MLADILDIEQAFLGFKCIGCIEDWNPESKSYWQWLESSSWKSGIQGVESSIQDCLEFPIHGAIKELRAKVDMLKDERLYYNMEVHQRRESLRLFGIEESSTADSDEDTKQVLVDFLEDKLGIAIAKNLETVHRIGKFSNSKGNQGR